MSDSHVVGDNVYEPPDVVGDVRLPRKYAPRPSRFLILWATFTTGAFADDFAKLTACDEEEEQLASALEEQAGVHPTVLGVAWIEASLCASDQYFGPDCLLRTFATRACRGQVRGFVRYEVLNQVLLEDPARIDGDDFEVWQMARDRRTETGRTVKEVAAGWCDGLLVAPTVWRVPEISC